MQKAFIFVLLLSVLHRSRASDVTIESHAVMSTTGGCTNAIMVATEYVSVDFCPETAYATDICVVFTPGEGGSTFAPCADSAQSDLKLMMMAGPTDTPKTITKTALVPAASMTTAHTQCVAIAAKDIVGEFLNKAFYDVRFKAEVSLKATLGGGSVKAEIRASVLKTEMASTFTNVRMDPNKVYTVLCRKVAGCTVTHSESTGTVTTEDPVYLDKVAGKAPMFNAVTTAVDAAGNVFLTKTFRCNGVAACMVTFTVAAS